MENGTNSEERNIWENLCAEWQQLLVPYENARVTQNVAADEFLWETAENQLILKGDAAVELGGGNLPAVSGVLYRFDANAPAEIKDADAAGTDRAELVRTEPIRTESDGGDGTKFVTLYGADLPEHKGNVPYARVTLVRLKREFRTEEFKLYNLLRSIEYIRYRVSPSGYMPRISTAQSREQVRVSAEALGKGLDFYKVGRIYEDAYLRHPAVEAAETVFITLPEFDYRALQTLFERAEHAVMALDHPLNNLKMDCDSCNLKAVCDEVEKLCDADREGRSV